MITVAVPMPEPSPQAAEQHRHRNYNCRDRSPEFAATYQAIAHRRGKKIATTAIARKLITRAYHVLREVDSRRPGRYR